MVHLSAILTIYHNTNDIYYNMVHRQTNIFNSMYKGRQLSEIHFPANYTHLPITRMWNRDPYRISKRGVSGLALEESKMHDFSRI